jgi:hypothetical protein
MNGYPPRFPNAGGPTFGPTSTTSNGSFSLRFDANEGGFKVWPKWSLILKKGGYADEVIDISPEGEPASATETQLIAVVAYMRVEK